MLVILFLMLTLIAIVIGFVHVINNNMDESMVWVFASLFSAICLNGVM